MDRLIDRTLLATAPAVGTAREQAMQIARAALVVRDIEPDAKIAIGRGGPRSWRGFPSVA